MHVATCRCEDDAAIVADFALVADGREPKNFTAPWDSVKAWVEAGGNSDVPAVERVVLRGDVCVNGKESVAAEARDAAAAVEDKIAAKARDPRTKTDYFSFLSEMSDVPGAEWMAALADVSEDVETVGELATVNVFDKDITLAFTGRNDSSARRRLWRIKRDAAYFLGVRIPKEPPLKNGTGKAVSKRERTTKQQHALDVTARWAASRGGTEDEKLATEYAEALAAIARGGVEEPPQKKRRC